MKIIIFDGFCNFCEFWVNFVIKHEKNNDFHFISLQSEKLEDFIEVDKIPAKIDSVILYEEGAMYFKSDAALKIAANLRSPYSLLRFFKFLPETFRNLIYDYIAANRYKWFGKKNSCLIPDDRIKNKFLA